MFQQVFENLRTQSRALRSSTVSDRRRKLRRLRETLERREMDALAALKKDFGKPEAEGLLTELYPVHHEIAVALRRLPEWMEPRPVPSRLMYMGTRSYMRSEPKGVVLIISPWNYPIQLALAPLVSAIAAGNTVLLKPSELTPACSQFLKELLAEVFPENEVFVALGGAEVSQALLKLPLNHVFFTGSTQVGRKIMEAAAQIPCEVTLELGGKCPALIDESADLGLAAEKILWGKWINGGQTCVAPDFLLVPRSKESAFLEQLRKTAARFASGAPATDQALIITDRHRQRLAELAAPHEKLETLPSRTEDRALPLQILNNPPLHSPVMREEIFGPLLPWIPYDDFDEALGTISRMDSPLSFYVFSRNARNIEKALREIPAGAVCINEAVTHLGQHELPFGGVGPSGIGRYHGDHGFRTFSHEKPILHRTWGRWTFRMIYPPYSPKKLRLIRWLMKLGF